MSYLVLARKWRPMHFEQVVSQQHVTTTLKNAIQQDRLASAYLFSGPRGVGKTTTARIFAKAINCEKGPTPTPCNTCSACQEITESRSLDVFEIDGASNRGIDEVRNLRQNLKYAASKGKHKIYIIDEVHMLTTEAFNALLKTLEEPPPNVLFIFATTEFHKVPATILSRCQRYDFRRIPADEIVEQLRKICAEETIEIDDESLFLLAKKSDGSMRDSQSLLDQVISFCGQEIKLEELAELLGIIAQEIYFACSDIIHDKDVPAGLQLVEKIFTQGYDMAEFLNGLAEHFRNILVVKATDGVDLLEGLDSYTKRYQETAPSFSETDLLRLIQLSSEAAYQIKRSANPKLALEMTVVKMIKMDKSVELNTLLSNLNTLGGGQATPVAPDSSASGASASARASSHLNSSQQFQPATGGDNTTNRETQAAPTQAGVSSRAQPEQTTSEAVTLQQIKSTVSDSHGKYAKTPANGAGSPQVDQDAPEKCVVSLERIKTDWLKIVDGVKNRKIHLGSFLNEGYPTSLHEEILEISFGKDAGFHMKTVETNKTIVQEVIFEQTGFRLRIRCHKNESEEFNQMLTQRRPEAVVAEQPAAEDEDVLQIPIVKKVIEVFDGEFVKSKGKT